MAPKKAKPQKLSGADLKAFLGDQAPSGYGVPVGKSNPKPGPAALAPPKRAAATASNAPPVPAPTTKSIHYTSAVSFLVPRKSVEPLLVCGAWIGIASEWDALSAARMAEIASESGLPLTRPSSAIQLIASGAAVLPLLVRKALPRILERVGDKSEVVAASAAQAADAILQELSPYGVMVALPVLLKSLTPLRKPEELEFSLFMVSLLAKLHPEQMAWCLQDAVAATIPLMTHIKNHVWKGAVSTMTALCEASGNRDIQPAVSDILQCIRVSDKVCESIENLASVVFVQAVETPVLAVMTPVLVRGLQSRKSSTIRKACTIAGNMVKMVPDMKELRAFVPQLLPLVDRAREEISDPEARGMAQRVFETLKSAESSVPAALDQSLILEELRHIVPDFQADILEYVASLSCCIASSRCFDVATWRGELLRFGLPEGSAERLMSLFLEAAHAGEDEDDTSAEGHDLCNCTFTLGYGNLTLLSNARLHLKEGKVYGLLGANGCGKTTLMRAISNEQVAGFPPKIEVRCSFLEHAGIGESEPECDMLPEEYILSNKLVKAEIKAQRLKKDGVRQELEKVGFRSGIELDTRLGCLSAGWKVKVGLVGAMLSQADVLLLDEPTNHLDVGNALWLADYINALAQKSKPVSVIMNSHDSLFLERTCTHIILYEQFKLKTRQGKLSEVVAKVPSAKNHFELAVGKFSFVFPEPGFLAPQSGEAATTTRSRVLLRMSDVHFTYPGSDREILCGVGVKVSMLSRVAILGNNGTGKSTMIKCLLGELLPTTGQVWKHPGARVAYVEQHAFGHLEDKLNKTATQYILDRFAGFKDSESMEHRARIGETAESPAVVRRMRLVDGNLAECQGKQKPVVLEEVLGKRKCKKKKGLEYEVRWLGRPKGETMWLHADEMDEMGFKRDRQRLDELATAASGLWQKPLTTAAVEKHLANFSLDPEFATHTKLRTLSGGQKVKVVLAAALWPDPHIVVLDEPTNYLDADALGALTQAIQTFKGGVLVISHNTEFCERCCKEKWAIHEGLVHSEGGDYAEEEAEGAESSEEDTPKFADEREKSLYDMEKKLRSDNKRGLLREDERRRLEDRIDKLKAKLSEQEWG
ncbi:unnamed protein product [Polarella glacialis]|uniref:AAA+ ATPase domain-containing protein n=1 Tax=Polarella glacialis TaxID=89957 RepID=A0A813L1H6_POLGL|nr:unnamed protein product [Polarella glacialis]